VAAGAPVPPVAAGVAGAGAEAGGRGAAVPPTTELGPRWPMIARASAPSMKSTEHTAVTFDSSVAPPRAPKAVWLLPPPNADAMSPPLPCCSRMTRSSSRHTKTYNVVNR